MNIPQSHIIYLLNDDFITDISYSLFIKIYLQTGLILTSKPELNYYGYEVIIK